MDSPWHRAGADIVTYSPEELFGTKLRALLQRRKGRDLFDLHHGLVDLGLDASKVVAAFDHYPAIEATTISRAQAEERMLLKLTRSLTEDVTPLLPVGVNFGESDALHAFERVWRDLISKIRGEAWKLTDKTIDDLRANGFPGLLSK